MLPKVKISNLNKSFYKDGVEIKVLDDINLNLYDGEFVSIIGPSGCGKSTVFSIICNLQDADSGNIIIDGSKNQNKTFAYMPQKDLLFPWRKLKDNMILPLEINGENRDKAYRKVDSLFDTFGLSGFENAYPYELSGGMKQRAALLRTFLIDSDIMLLDEPFGAVDAINRDKLQRWLLDVWSEFRRSVFFITHSIDEAIYLSDRVYVLSERPASVKLEIKIDLGRPRNKDIITSQKFMDYKTCLLSTLE